MEVKRLKCAKLGASVVVCIYPSIFRPDTSKMIATANVTTEWSYQTLIRGIFPGTLWCGFGNIADDTFGQLGTLQIIIAIKPVHDILWQI